MKINGWLNGNKQVKKVKVTERDIQNNILRIKAKMDNTKVGTDEYKILQEELEHEYVILKKYKDSRFIIQPKDAIVIGGTLFAGIFFIALDRENPKALKMAQYLLKLFPYKA